MRILGIQYDSHLFCHDTAAALIDGQIVVGYLEEERFTRKKHAVGQFPINAIKELLSKAQIDFKDIDIVAVSTESSVQDIKIELHKHFKFNDEKVVFNAIDHHIAHILDSYYHSQFNDCAAIVVDGQGGQNDSITIAQINCGKIEVLRKFDLSMSLGYMYELASIYCGFGKWGCGKLMGLAAFGTPLDIKPYFQFDEHGFYIDDKYKKIYEFAEHRLQIDNRSFNQYLSRFFSQKDLTAINIFEKTIIVSIFKFFETIYPYEPCKDTTAIMYYSNFAATIQKIFSNTICKIVELTRHLVSTSIDKLILAGGCMQNCAANSMIIDLGLFSSVQCSPSPYDSGCALGNALAISMQQKNTLNNSRFFPAYSGKCYDQLDISRFKTRVEITNISINQIAEDLYHGKIIGWFQGGSEIGPRALCHRSIIANPSIRSSLYRINSKIKGRQQFRPLAPVVRDIDFFKIFDATSHDMAQFMLRTFKIKDAFKKKFLAVCHIDGTSRPQFLQYDTNPEMYSLLTSFNELANIPGLINTSFNRNNEPIVETIDDAIDMLLDVIELDYIVFNSSLKISRKQ